MNFFLPWFSNLKTMNVLVSFHCYVMKMSCSTPNFRSAARYIHSFCVCYCYCCCWCYVASVVSDSMRPQRQQPTRLPVPGILQARTLEWVAISFSNAWKWKVKVKSFSCVWLLATPWTAAHQAPPSMGFSRQEYWSGVPLPSPGLVI